MFEVRILIVKISRYRMVAHHLMDILAVLPHLVVIVVVLLFRWVDRHLNHPLLVVASVRGPLCSHRNRVVSWHFVEFEIVENVAILMLETRTIQNLKLLGPRLALGRFFLFFVALPLEDSPIEGPPRFFLYPYQQFFLPLSQIAFSIIIIVIFLLRMVKSMHYVLLLDSVC